MTSSSSLDFIETDWVLGTEMKFIDLRKQNVVHLIHSIEHKTANVRMPTGGPHLTGDEISAFSQSNVFFWAKCKHRIMVGMEK